MWLKDYEDENSIEFDDDYCPICRCILELDGFCPICDHADELLKEGKYAND